MTDHKLLGHGAALITIVFWGTTFISSKVLLETFTPFELLFYRFLLAFIVLFLVRPKPFFTKGFQEEKYFILAGFCGVTLYFSFENIALTYTLASNVSVIITASPFFTAIFAYCFLGEKKLKPYFFLGFGAGILGIVFISFNGKFVLQLNPLGDLLALLASVSWALYSIITKKISAFGYPIVYVTRRVFLYGLIFLMPLFILSPSRLGLERFSDPQNLLNILYLGMGASALCFGTWNYAVTVLGVVKTSIYIYIVPVVTVLTSFVILKETITGIAAMGMGLTLFGLYLSEKGTFN